MGFKTSIALYFIQAFILSHKKHVISIIEMCFPLMQNLVQNYKICHMPPVIIVYQCRIQNLILHSNKLISRVYYEDIIERL